MKTGGLCYYKKARIIIIVQQLFWVRNFFYCKAYLLGRLGLHIKEQTHFNS